MTRAKGSNMGPAARAIWEVVAAAGPSGLSRCAVVARAPRSLSRQSVWQAVNGLVYQGYVERFDHSGVGRHQRSQYRICLGQVPAWASLPAAWAAADLEADDSTEDSAPLSKPAQPPTPFPYSVFTYHHVLHGTRPASPCK